MSVLAVAGSLLGGAVFVVAGAVVAVTARRLFFPAWRGTVALTTMVMVWLCWALALGQLLGAVGLLRRVALLCGALISAAAAIGLRRLVDRRPRRVYEAESPPTPEPTTTKTWEQQALTLGTVLLVSVVAAIWIARTVIALHRGINDPDSLGYHIPFIVTFAHSGYADQHRFLRPYLPVHFYPANDELLAAMALAITHSLGFAAAKNLIYGAFTLVAAHALGKAFGAARLTVAAAAIVLGFPVFGFSQPGEAVNDALLIVLLVGGLALLAHARQRPAAYVLALACAGGALGVKFSGIVIAAALAVLAMVLLLTQVSRHRWRWAGAGALGSAALGGSWYVRNAINYGNPLPPVKIGLGPLHLRHVPDTAYTVAYSVAHYAFHGRLLRVFAHGLFFGLGPLFAVTAVLCLLGAVAACRSRDRFRFGLVALTAVGILGYLVTPAGAYGPPSVVPGSFVINLHYAVPALLAGALAGAIALGGWRWAGILPPLGVAAVATSIGRGRRISVWSPEMGGPGFALLLAAAVVATAAVAAWLRPSFRRWAVGGAAATTAVVAVAVAVVAFRYPSRQAKDPLARWAAAGHHGRIGAWVANVADLYGPSARNDVAVISQLMDGAAVSINTCPGFKRAVRDGKFQYTAVTAATAWSRWLQADPAFRLVVDEGRGAAPDDLASARRYQTLVFQVVGPPDVSCPGQPDAVLGSGA